MNIKDLFAMCDKDKLMTCIAEKYRDAADGMVGVEAVSARFLPVLEELSGMTPLSDGKHFALAMQGEDGLEVMEFYTPDAEKWLQTMSAMQDMAEEKLSSSQEVLNWAAQLSDINFHAFTYIPWVEVLDTQVFADNVHEFGAEEMAAQILFEMTEAGFTAEAVEAQIQCLEELLAKTKYSSLGMLLVDKLLIERSDEKMLEWQRKRALNNYHIYHLLKRYSALWSS